MSYLHPRVVCLALLAFLSAPGFAAAAGSLSVTDAWIRAAPPGAQVMAGYATLANVGDEPLTVLAVQSADFRQGALHETVEEGGMAKMRELHRLAIEPGARASLAPGGKHLMLMQPRRAIAAGDRVEVVFLLGDGTRHQTFFDVVDTAATDAHAHE